MSDLRRLRAPLFSCCKTGVDFRVRFAYAGKVEKARENAALVIATSIIVADPAARTGPPAQP